MAVDLGARRRPVRLDSRKYFAPSKPRRHILFGWKPTRTWFISLIVPILIEFKERATLLNQWNVASTDDTTMTGGLGIRRRRSGSLEGRSEGRRCTKCVLAFRLQSTFLCARPDPLLISHKMRRVK